MSDILKKYRTAWQKQSINESDQLKEAQIMDFIMNQSKSITTGYRRSLVFDICFKAVLLMSFLVLAYLLRANSNLVVLNIILMTISGGLLVLQSKHFRQTRVYVQPEHAMKEFLENSIAYFNKKMKRAIYLAALSNPLFFLCGSLFYFYFVYGTVRPLDLQDYLVFSSCVVLSFLIAAFAQIQQHIFQVKQLEACLNDLDDAKMNLLVTKKRKRQGLVMFLLWVGLLLFGLIAMSYFFIS